VPVPRARRRRQHARRGDSHGRVQPVQPTGTDVRGQPGRAPLAGMMHGRRHDGSISAAHCDRRFRAVHQPAGTWARARPGRLTQRAPLHGVFAAVACAVSLPRAEAFKAYEAPCPATCGQPTEAPALPRRRPMREPLRPVRIGAEDAQAAAVSRCGVELSSTCCLHVLGHTNRCAQGGAVRVMDLPEPAEFEPRVPTGHRPVLPAQSLGVR